MLKKVSINGKIVEIQINAGMSAPEFVEKWDAFLAEHSSHILFEHTACNFHGRVVFEGFGEDRVVKYPDEDSNIFSENWEIIECRDCGIFMDVTNGEFISPIE